MKSFIIWCLLLVLTVLPQVADGAARSTTRYDRAQGLDLFSITVAVQDNFGFLWLAGQDGIVRFDGYEFVRLEHLVRKKTLPFTPFVWDMLVDSKHRLWVASYGGLAQIDLETYRLNVYRLPKQDQSRAQVLSSLIEDGNGTIWVGTAGRGLWYFDERHSKLFEVPSPAAAAYINDMALVGDTIWIAAGPDFIRQQGHGALLSYQIPQKKWEIYPSPGQVGVTEIVSHDNSLWIGTFGKGVRRFSIAERKWDGISYLADQAVMSLIEDRDTLWVGTTNGLYKIDKDGNVRKPSLGRNIALDAMIVSTLLVDASQNLWIGTWTQGLLKRPLFDNGIQTSHPTKNSRLGAKVLDVQEMPDGHLWVAQFESGLSQWSPSTGWQPLPQLTKQLAGFPRQLLLDTKQQLWIGTTQALYRLPPPYQVPILVADVSSSPCASNVLKLVLDSVHQSVWVGTRSGGACRFDLQGKLTQRISTSLTAPDAGLLSPSVTAIYLDDHQRIWLGSEQTGLSIYDPNSQKVAHFTLSDGLGLMNDVVTDIVQDSHNNIWLATEGGGLHHVLLDKDGMPYLFEAITTAEGLANNAISSVQPVDDVLWLATTVGLTRFYPTKKEIQNFHVDNQFYNGARHLTQQGLVIFGGTDGLTWLQPEKVKRNPHKPPVVLTGLRMGNQSFLPPPKIVRTDSGKSVAITIPYQQNMFIIEFSGLDFVEPLSNRYRYKLEGFDNDWLETDARRRLAAYTNLPAGQYLFRVQASNSDGIWNTEGLSVPVNIESAPWQTHWPKIFVLCLTLVLLAYMYWVWQQKNKLKKAHHQALQESEERLKLSLWASGDEFWDWDIRKGTMVRTNELPLNVIPKPLFQERISAISDYVHPDDLQPLIKAYLMHRNGHQALFECRYRLKDQNNEWQWVLDRGKFVSWDDSGRPIRMVGMLRDIDNLKKTEERLQVIAQSLANTSDAVWITTTDFTCLFVNSAFEKLTGFPADKLVGKPMSLAEITGNEIQIEKAIKHYLKLQGHWRGELHCTRENGDTYTVKLTIDNVQNEESKITHYIGVFSDISHLKASQARLKTLSEYDKLTALYSQQHFMTLLQRRLDESTFQLNDQLGIAIISIDQFKNINDYFGMATGDTLLRAFADRLIKMADNEMLCARYTGDEFMLATGVSNSRQALIRQIYRIIDQLRMPFHVHNHHIRVEMSVGIAFAPAHGTAPIALFEHAHIAMSHVKRQGGNDVQIFNDSILARTQVGREIEGELLKAIEREEIKLLIRPVVDLETKRAVKGDLMLVWDSPKRGRLTASHFAPIAFQTGMLPLLAEWVINKVADYTRQCQRQGILIPLCTPVSELVLSRPWLIEQFLKQIESLRLAEHYIHLAVDEQCLHKHQPNVRRSLELLHEHAIPLEVIGFSTQQFALSWLRHHSVVGIRLPSHLTRQIGQKELYEQTLLALLDIASTHSGLEAIAHGIDNEEQLEWLVSHSCRFGTGPMFGAPRSLDDWISDMCSS